MPQKRAWEVWDKPGIAEHVDAYWRSSSDEKQHRINLAALVAGLLQKPSDAILEIGCGTGLVYEALVDRLGCGLNYVGVDNSMKMLAIARNRFPMARFSFGDAFKLKFKNRRFQVTCAFEVFGHMPDCTEALAEMLRVTRQTAAFTVWADGSDRISDGGEHYIYGLGKMEAIIAKVCRGRNYVQDIIGLSPVSAIVLLGLDS